MRSKGNDTPPSSINGDEITGMEEDGVVFLEEVEEIQLEDEEMDAWQLDSEEEPPEDHSKFVFNKHDGSVFCCDIHPEGKLAVTGGEDDKAYVWSMEDGQIFMECIGHKDSVVFVGFSFDGAFLATVDMSGVIKVWKVMENNLKDPWPLAFEYEVDDLSFSLWHFGARVLICGVVDGDIYVFKIPSGDTKVLQGNSSRAECAKLFKDGVRLAAGYGDGSIKVWDLKASKVLCQVSESHEDSVTAIDTHPDNNLMASICMANTLILSTSSNGKVVHKQVVDLAVETVAFAQDPELGYFGLGALSGSITIWDVAKQMVRHECDSEGFSPGVTKMTWIKNHLIVGCTDGSIRGYEGKSGVRSLLLTGNRSEVLDYSYNENTNTILTATDDGTCRIFTCELKTDN